MTLKIPDEKFEFFMELMHVLGIKIFEQSDIPEEHKSIVRECIKKSNQNPDRLMNWEDIKDSFELD